VVEDSPTQLEKLRSLLDESGFSVVGATDGKKGLAAAKANPIDLVISDIVMPEMDGYALCKALRADETLRHVPVILLTALADPRDVIQGLESGANNFICKPYEDRALVARVQNVLANQEIRNAASSEMGISVLFAGQRFFITAERLQILDLLLSTYENAVGHNSELIRTRDELRVLNEQLETRVAERTAALTVQIEEREQAVEALAASEVRYRRLFEAARDGILILDAETGLVVDVNPYLVELLGFSRAEFLGKRVWELGPLRNVVAARDAFSELQARDYLRYEDLPLQTRDGRSVDVEFVSNAYLVDNKKVIQCNIRDITERKRGEDALRENEARLRDITFSMGDWVWEVDENGVYTYSSSKGLELLGDVIGKTPFDFMPPDEAKRMAATFSEIVARKAPIEDLENWNIGKKGRRICFLTNGVPILDEAGSLKGYRGVDKDITERKRAHDEREELQTQLAQAQKLESVGRLAGGVAHDFNNVLAIVLGHAEAAVNASGPADPLRHHVETIRQAALRGADLTRQLLAFAHKQTIEPRALDPNAVVANTLKMLRRLMGEDINLVWMPEAASWPVKMDPAQMDQILANLLVNARDAIGGVGQVTITTQNVVLGDQDCVGRPGFVPGEYVMLVVTDSGCGMGKDVRDHVFEPFFTTKPLGQGTGLGLATVYGIVKQNAGAIGVESEPGKGTTFRIYLPRSVAEIPAAEAAATATEPRGHGETVLLVEDQLPLLDVTRETLADLGYSVLTAGDPSTALRTAQAHAGEIQLLITDVVMPGMNGRDLSERLAASRPGIRCLFISGYTADIIAKSGVLDEGLDFLQKPFSRLALATKVRQAIDG
jgi:PAS domain S-box-containing protein